jgi:hypothetical protein
VFPLVAARMELILIEGVLVVVPFTNELTADTELMMFYLGFPETLSLKAAWDPRDIPRNL